MDTLLALNNVDESDFGKAKDLTIKARKLLLKPKMPLILAVRLESGTLYNIKTDSFDVGPIKAVRLMAAAKSGDNYTPQWYRSFYRGRVYLPISGADLPIRHISVHNQEEGGPPPQKNSVNLEVEKLEVIYAGGKNLLINVAFESEVLFTRDMEPELARLS